MTFRSHTMPFGAEIREDGVEFRLWAPGAQRVALVVDGTRHAMPTGPNGWHRLKTAAAKPGSRYGFEVADGLIVPDPASRFQPQDVHDLSLVVDPEAYRWSDDDWLGRPWEDAVIYETHVGAATAEGTFRGLQARLADLRETGITALELMPVSDFPGRRNWGYDGVLPYAPDAGYGSVEELKALVDHAHRLGLMIILDVVYNHFGPDGNYLGAYAPQFFTERHRTPWGAGLNFDGTSGPTVRDFFIHNALYWLEEFHVDGLRFDAVHAILDDSDTHILAEIAGRVRAALPARQIHLVLENDANEARWLARDDRGQAALYTAQWNDDLHHAWHVLLTGETEGYYEDYAQMPGKPPGQRDIQRQDVDPNPIDETAIRRAAIGHLGRALATGFGYQGEPSLHRGGAARGEPSGHLPPQAFVAFLQNHDQIGNRAFGERLARLAPARRLSLARAALLLSPQIPLLFMGEDWDATAPFQYFVDFPENQALSRAVREGRQREFARFKAFSDPGTGNALPDPTAEATFERSVLDWNEIRTLPHAAIREEVSRLLMLRRSHIASLIKSPFRGANAVPSGDTLDVIWNFEAGQLRFVAAFGPADFVVPIEAETILWRSDDAAAHADRLILPGWTGAFLLTDHSAGAP